MFPNNISSTVIIFDWDDTICPSSFVDQCQIQSFNDIPLHYQNLLDEIGRAAEQCLEVASQHGEVIIITNSDDGWVKFSAERYCPRLVPILPKYRIVSARTTYEQFYPGQPLCWKAAAFAHEVNEFYSGMHNHDDKQSSTGYHNEHPIKSDLISTHDQRGNFPSDSLVSTDESSDDSDLYHGMHEMKPSSYYNNNTISSSRTTRAVKHKNISNNQESRPLMNREIISFGDSMEERTAVQIVSKQLGALAKSVMFLTSPSPEQLIGQLTMLTGYMKHICENKRVLDLEISVDQAERMAQTVLHASSSQLPNKMSNGFNETKFPLQSYPVKFEMSEHAHEGNNEEAYDPWHQDNIPRTHRSVSKSSGQRKLHYIENDSCPGETYSL